MNICFGELKFATWTPVFLQIEINWSLSNPITAAIFPVWSLVASSIKKERRSTKPTVSENDKAFEAQSAEYSPKLKPAVNLTANFRNFGLCSKAFNAAILKVRIPGWQ